MPGSFLEKAYYKMPFFVQDGIFSVYGWNLSRKRYNPFFHERLERLKEMEWWSASQIEEYQNEHVVRIVRHAYETTPFYRTFYDRHGVDIGRIKSISDLHHLPVLTKQMVREHQHEMVSSAFGRGSLHKVLTSGTTGTPLTVYFTPEGLAYQWAVWWRHRSRFGIELKDRHLSFGARVPVAQSQSRPPYWRNDFFNHRVYLSSYHLSQRTVADIVAYLNRTPFVFFAGYPSAMYALAVLMETSGLRLQQAPRYVVTGSDTLLPSYEALIHQVFGAPVTEQYGMAEFAGNLSKCPQGVFHEDFECCHVETQSREGSEAHSLIMTGWGNWAMPFIRYEVGDYGRPTPQRCACGRESRCFSNIDGRLEDYVVTPDGRKLIGMNQVFEYAPHAREIQLYQRSPNEIEFRVVPKEGFGDSDKEALVREFQRRGGTDMDIKFRMVDQLERSSSGKLKAVISEAGRETGR